MIATAPVGGTRDLVAVTIDGQSFGIPVESVRDVLGPHPVTPIPLAPDSVAGAMNLRGRIVTAIDVRQRLGMPARATLDAGMNVVVDHAGDLYSLAVDSIGDVLAVPADALEDAPGTLDPRWRAVCAGLCRLETALMVVLDVARLLEIRRGEAA